MGDQPTPTHDPHAALAAAAGPWLSGHHSGPNAGLADALRTWFDAIGAAVPEGVSLLFGCARDDCSGHEDSHTAILHSLQDLADGQRTTNHRLATVERALGTSTKKEQSIMGIAEDILAAENTNAAAVQALGGSIVTVVGKLTDVEGQLAAVLANGTLTDEDKAALQTALDTATATKTALDADLAAVNEALNPTPPVTDPGTGDTGDGTDSGEGNGTTDVGDVPVDGTPADGSTDGDTTPVSE